MTFLKTYTYSFGAEDLVPFGAQECVHFYSNANIELKSLSQGL
jgi:hypothetical protein